MDSIVSVIMPEAMVSSIENLAKNKNCSKNTILKLAVAKFLFDQTLQTPKIFDKKIQVKQLKTSDDIANEIPLDKIISVQYTLDDGRVIHILRETNI